MLVTSGYWFKLGLIHLFQIMMCHRFSAMITLISGNNKVSRPGNSNFLTCTIYVSILADKSINSNTVFKVLHEQTALQIPF